MSFKYIRAMQVHIGMAAQPQRFNNLPTSVPILLDQCDRMFVHINGSTEYPDCLDHPKITVTTSEENLGAAQKFCGVPETDGYYVSVDDDILYPKDYVDRLLEAMERHDNKIIACVHASTYYPHQPVWKRYERRKSYCYYKTLRRETRVLQPGTGTVCTYVPHFAMRPEDFENPNMTDVYMMIALAKRGIKAYAIHRRHHWMNRMDEHGVALHDNVQRPKVMRAICKNLNVLRDLFEKPEEKKVKWDPDKAYYKNLHAQEEGKVSWKLLPEWKD
jgi:hypothetical protein